MRAVCSLENMSPLDYVSMIFDSYITLICCFLRLWVVQRFLLNMIMNMAAKTRTNLQILYLQYLTYFRHSWTHAVMHKHAPTDVIKLNSCTNMHKHSPRLFSENWIHLNLCFFPMEVIAYNNKQVKRVGSDQLNRLFI